MPRVPFVGRLHLYLPPFRPRASESLPPQHPEEKPKKHIRFDLSLEASDSGGGSSEGVVEGERGVRAAVASGSDSRGAAAGGIATTATSKHVERERLYYKFKEEEEKESQRKKKISKWFKDEANAFLSSSLPFWRRNSQEYVALIVSFCFLIVESVIRIITLALRRVTCMDRELCGWVG